MGNKRRHFWIGLALATCLLSATRLSWKNDPIALEFPDFWPKPTHNFAKNPLSKQVVELGRRLFYDPILSRDSTVSCSNCHLSFTAFTHVDHALSHGIEDRVGTRNSPALMNLAWGESFMWDGAVTHLDFQALAPISSPAEMDHSIEKVVQKVQSKPAYKARFFEAFGDSTVTGERLLKAIAQFELTLISDDSKYDQMRAGQVQFTEQEQKGYLIFQKNCAKCHTEPLFTNQAFENNGLPLDTSLQDFGRMKISKNPKDSLKFKVPTLRNIEFSYPYMHDGRFKKLRDVMQHYAKNTNLKPPMELSPNDQVDLVAFLLTLSDRAFLFNPNFSFPRD